MKHPADYSQDLVSALKEGVPIAELVACARANLKATRKVRMSKDDPDGSDEPEYATRQRALEWIGNQIAGAAATRKPIEAPTVESEAKPSPGLLKAGAKGKSPQ